SPRPRAARFAARHIGAAAAAVRAGLALAHLFGPERLHRISLRLRRRHKVIPLIPAHLPRPAGRR
ncbi:hypothetical protein, partial [Chromobacterium haemolyticum]|uniref:hypothetical protein n=1 Tax=Chromobacterium haemolyticum TaxID=394935 RepID=UPI0005851765